MVDSSRISQPDDEHQVVNPSSITSTGDDVIKGQATITTAKENPSSDSRGDGPAQLSDVANPSQGRQSVMADFQAVPAAALNQAAPLASATQYSMSAVHGGQNGGDRLFQMDEANHQVIRPAGPSQGHTPDTDLGQQAQALSLSPGRLTDSLEGSYSVHNDSDASTRRYKRSGSERGCKALSSSSMDVNLDDVPIDSWSEHSKDGEKARRVARVDSEQYIRPAAYPRPLGPVERVQRIKDFTWQTQFAGIPYRPSFHAASAELNISGEEDSEPGA